MSDVYAGRPSSSYVLKGEEEPYARAFARMYRPSGKTACIGGKVTVPSALFEKLGEETRELLAKDAPKLRYARPKSE